MSGGIIGASFGGILADDNSTINLSGGEVTFDVNTQSSSLVNWSGGTVNGMVFVQDGSLLDIFGIHLSSVLTDPNFEGFYSEYTLSGSLLDNSDATGRQIFVQNGSGAGLVITNQSAVPEPSALFSMSLILALCGMAVAIRSRNINRRVRF